MIDKKDIHNNTNVICYIYDFLIKDTNILIEINGNYIHANPRLYDNPNQKLSYRGKAFKVKDRWKLDSDKKRLAKDQGYRLITIWENFSHREAALKLKNIIK